jgi:hypothetical protein
MGYNPAKIKDMTERRKKWKKIQDEIEEFFKSKGVKSRTIYRTCQMAFGLTEPPHNLPPNVGDQVVVYVSFKDNRIEKSNIQFILAFLANDFACFPLVEHSRLHIVQPVDITRIPDKYKFNDIDELFSEFFRRFQ